MVVMRVKVDLEQVALAPLVAPRQTRSDAVGAGVVADAGDVEGVVVVGHLKGGALRRRLAVVRVVLREPLVYGCAQPDCVVDDAVEARRHLSPHGAGGALGVRHPKLHLGIAGVGVGGLLIGYGCLGDEKNGG